MNICSNAICGTYLPVNEEGGKDQWSKCEMDEVVWRMSARNLIVVCGVVVDADSKQEVEEAVHQTNHKQPNWK